MNTLGQIGSQRPNPPPVRCPLGHGRRCLVRGIGGQKIIEASRLKFDVLSITMRIRGFNARQNNRCPRRVAVDSRGGGFAHGFQPLEPGTSNWRVNLLLPLGSSPLGLLLGSSRAGTFEIGEPRPADVTEASLPASSRPQLASLSPANSKDIALPEPEQKILRADRPAGSAPDAGRRSSGPRSLRASITSDGSPMAGGRPLTSSHIGIMGGLAPWRFPCRVRQRYAGCRCSLVPPFTLKTPPSAPRILPAMQPRRCHQAPGTPPSRLSREPQAVCPDTVGVKPRPNRLHYRALIAIAVQGDHRILQAKKLQNLPLAAKIPEKRIHTRPSMPDNHDQSNARFLCECTIVKSQDGAR